MIENNHHSNTPCNTPPPLPAYYSCVQCVLDIYLFKQLSNQKVRQLSKKSFLCLKCVLGV